MREIEIIRPGERLQIDPNAGGLAHGYSLFETMALRGGYLEFWAAHWQRLQSAAWHFGLPCDYPEAQVLAAVADLAKELEGEGVIKLSLLKEADGVRLIIYSRPPLFRSEGEVGLLIQDGFRINQYSPLAGYKTHNYLESMLAAALGHKAGCYDVLRLNTEEFLAEGAVSNIFFYSDGCLKTPSVEAGLLPGVVRAVLLEQLKVEEGLFTIDTLMQAEAVFLTNSTVGPLPVDYLLRDGLRVHRDSRGHFILEKIRESWSRKLEATRVQIFH
jgi:4-amino-4-deoxychorismate lyase